LEVFELNLLHQWLLAAFSLGLDSFLAGLVVGPILLSWGGRTRLALGFGLCDGLASWAGACMPHQLLRFPDVVAYVCCVPLLLASATRSRAWLYALPLVLSIDNLAAGIPASQTPILALSSAAMAAVGLALGGLGRAAAAWMLPLHTKAAT
jgi:putative Mn2+ efflux pump MntP